MQINICFSSANKTEKKEVDEMDQYNLESYDAEVEASSKSKF
jgi:hypothetical protein